MVMLCIQACEKKARLRKWRTTGGRKDQLKFFMDETEQRVTSRSALNSKGSFKCFGFGYNGFAQLSAHNSARKDNETPNPSSVVVPSPVPLDVDCVSSIVASWSCSFYLKGWCYSGRQFFKFLITICIIFELKA